MNKELDLEVNYWPGYLDALANVFASLIFVLAIFVVVFAIVNVESYPGALKLAERESSASLEPVKQNEMVRDVVGDGYSLDRNAIVTIREKQVEAVAKAEDDNEVKQLQKENQDLIREALLLKNELEKFKKTIPVEVIVERGVKNEFQNNSTAKEESSPIVLFADVSATADSLDPIELSRSHGMSYVGQWQVEPNATTWSQQMKGVISLNPRATLIYVIVPSSNSRQRREAFQSLVLVKNELRKIAKNYSSYQFKIISNISGIEGQGNFARTVFLGENGGSK